jgi:heme/copper-type cytochrome/quinol oxidase subunit 2
MDSQNLSKNLKPISKLLKESFEIYRLKIKTLLGIVALPVGFSFFFWILRYFLSSTSIKYSFWFSLLEFISSLGTFSLWLLAIPSLIYSLEKNIGIKDSFKRGFKILLPYFWVWFLFNVIVAGAFLIFIIPGILFFIWFSLAIFVLLFEEKRGLNALFKSKHLIKRNFWKVFTRFLILFLIIVGVAFSLAFISVHFSPKNRQIADPLNQILSYFLQILLLPFILIYGFLIYNDLKEIKAEVPYKEPSKSKKIIYSLPGVLGTLILGLSLTIYFLNIFWGRDIPPIDDRDLWLPKIEIKKEENAFYPLNEAYKKIHLPKGEKSELFIKMGEGEEWDLEFAKELIKNNEEIFEYLEKAVELPYFQVPEPQLELTPFALIKIAHLSSIKANYLLTQGKEKEAIELIFKTIKIGQMIQDNPHIGLYDYLKGKAIKEVSLQRLRKMTPNFTLASDTLKSYIMELEQFKENEKGLIKAMKMDYIISTQEKSETASFIISRQIEGNLEAGRIIFGMIENKLNYLYKPNQTQALLAQFYRDFINNIYKDCNEIYASEIKRLTPYSKIKMVFTENIIGKMIYDAQNTAYFPTFYHKCSEDVSVSVAQLLLALKAYQMENGKLPDSLEELSPKYISQIPKDPFDGKPIKYLPEKKIIYSAGRDLKDSGGDEKEDLVFKIEF